MKKKKLNTKKISLSWINIYREAELPANNQNYMNEVSVWQSIFIG